MLGAKLIPLALLGALAAGPVLADEREIARYILVEGSGEATAVPDRATISAGVNNRSDTARAAMGENADAMTRVIEALKAAGVPDRSIRTSQLSVFPVYDHSNREDAEQRKPVAYQASNQVEVVIADLAKIGPTVDAMVAAGANQIQGIRFGIDDPTALEDSARKEAVADARRKAQLFAEAAGVALGPVLQIEERGGGGGFQPRMMAMESAKATPVSPGEQTIQTGVSIRFALGE